MSPLRIFYVAPVVPDKKGGPGDIAAVRNKVLGICEAIRSAEAVPIIVSSLASGQGASWVQPVRLRHGRKVCFVDSSIRGKKATRRLSALICLWLTGIVLISANDKVILYNFFPEYILLAVWLRLRGITCVMDCEDAPRSDEGGTRGRMTRCSFAILSRLCSPRYITASVGIGKVIGAENYLPVYGVSSFFSSGDQRPPIFTQTPIRIGYGGAMMRETGTELFKEAVSILRKTELNLHFFVTGHFEKELFDAFAAEINESATIKVFLYPDLDTAEYRNLARSLDIGLCLKLPSSEIGQTTFPSKVVEIAAIGLLLCTTSVSDVPLIFDDASAIILRSEQPEELASKLANAAQNPDLSRRQANAGRQTVIDLFSARNVGSLIVTFLNS